METTSPPHVAVARSGSQGVILVAGLGSSLLALVGVWALDAYGGENLMGWYASYVFPVGAILVGLVASSGFGLASWLTGTKITGRLLVAATVVLCAAYGAAQWLAFRAAFPDGLVLDDGTEAGLLDWFDLTTRAFAWKDHGRLGSALGAWGYLLRAGEVLGFCGGGLIAPAALRSVPYCDACGLYMRSSLVAVVPAAPAPRKVSKKDAAALRAREAEIAGAFAGGHEALRRILAAGRGGDAAAFAAAVDADGPLSRQREADKRPSRFHVRLVHCPRCARGELRAALVTGQGNELRTVPHEAQPLAPGAAPRLLAAKGRRAA